MMWPGAEPASGQFNETYFDMMQIILDRMAKSDMYALFDMHQGKYTILLIFYFFFIS